MTAVFRKAFHDSWRGVLWLLIGLGLYIVLIMSFYPTIVEQSAELDDLIRSMPRQITGMFISSDLENFSIADPGQFLHARYTSFLVLIAGALVIAQGFNAVLNMERDGTIDVMLSLPITRRRYLLGRMANTALMLLIVLATSVLTLGAFTLILDEFSLGIGELALAIFAGFFPLATTAAFAYMLSTLVPSSRSYAGGLAYLFLVGSYLIHGFAASVDELELIRPLLLFHYYDAAAIIRNGLNASHVLTLSAATLTFAAIAWWRIDKKELGV